MTNHPFDQIRDEFDDDDEYGDETLALEAALQDAIRGYLVAVIDHGAEPGPEHLDLSGLREILAGTLGLSGNLTEGQLDYFIMGIESAVGSTFSVVTTPGRWRLYDDGDAR